ncbi:MAG: 30S ribosomal protein S10 [Candidatus Hodgkinia cicadicola]|nr:MAG: 30S ribosomal protein S10 [Candidatus Hodgkinia cicadicola]
MWIKAKAFNKTQLAEYVDRLVLAFRPDDRFAIKGPIYLPTKIVKFTVNKSPHVDKKSRDQLEIRTHNRLVIVIGAYRMVVPRMLKLELPEGVFVEMRPFLATAGDLRYLSGNTAV